MFVLMSMSATKVAADVSQVAETSTSWWETVLGYAVPFIIVPLGAVLIRWLNNKARLTAAEANKAKTEGKSALKDELTVALLRIASNIANKERKDLEEAAEDGKVDKEDLKKLGEKAKETAISEFKEQGIDIVKELGPSILETSLRFIVDKINKK